MSFFVLEKDPRDDSLSIPLAGTFPTREAALAALSAAVTAGEAFVSGQVYVADLDAALPVLVMATPPAAAPASDSPAITQDVESDPVAPSAVDDVVVAVAGENGLAEALKRAASSLEDEGIVAPDSIDAEPSEVDLPEAVVEAAEAEVATPDIAAVEVGAADAWTADVAEPMSEAAAEVPASDATDEEVASIAAALSAPAEVTPPEVSQSAEEWPWANVEDYVTETEPGVALTASETPEVAGVAAPDAATDEDVAEAAEADAAAAVAEILGSLGGDDSLITSAPPEGEEAYVPRPVILGDYVEPRIVGEPEPVAADDFELPVEDEVVTDEVVPDAVMVVEVEPAVSPEPELPIIEGAYEPAGDLDMAAYTCNDCIYSNTCPKVGEVTPAECGSFQWKSS